MKKEKIIVLALLIGAVAGVCAIWPFHTAHACEGAGTDLDLVKMVSYSCSGGSIAEQSFSFLLQKEDGKTRFSCEYFANGHDSDDWEKYVVEDAELPAEYFDGLMRLMANVKFPDEHKQADDETIVLDAEIYSLTIYFTSGKSRNLQSYSRISEIENFFREIKQ